VFGNHRGEELNQINLRSPRSYDADYLVNRNLDKPIQSWIEQYRSFPFQTPPSIEAT
jgi:hypothetical protein